MLGLQKDGNVVAREVNTAQLLAAFKAAGEATRLRIIALLEMGELNVSDLTHILDQSQPRISRHLRLLSEAGLIERFREGSFVYCRLKENEILSELVNKAVRLLDPTDEVLANDRKRALALREERVRASQVWFKANARAWDQIRSLHVAESKVEAAMLEMLPEAKGKFDLLYDLGTGTGRVLELFAGRARQAIGVDTSHSMLEYARSRLDGKGFEHCQVRCGDLMELTYEEGRADIVILHQVLHFLMDPEKALFEAARLLKPGGRLLIVDFAPHDLDYLREKFAHERLGFSDEQIEAWLLNTGLVPERNKQLAAGGKGTEQPLNVSLWLAQKEDKSAKKMLSNNEKRRKVQSGEQEHG